MESKTLLFVFACAHCTLTGAAAVAALGLAALPTFLGVPLSSLLVPLLVAGGVVALLALHIRRLEREACEIPP